MRSRIVSAEEGQDSFPWPTTRGAAPSTNVALSRLRQIAGGYGREETA
jgi:hypothetical protein